MSQPSRRVVGVAFWLIAAILLAAAANERNQVNRSAGRVSTIDFFVRPVTQLEVVDASGRIQLNDPVFAVAADGTWSQVGHISEASLPEPNRFEMRWYDPSSDASQYDFQAYQSSGELEEVIATLFPPQKRRRIQLRLEQAMEAHGEEIMGALLPIVQRGLRESVPVIESEFRASLDRNRAEIDRLMERFNEDVIDECLIPLARQEMLPIVRKHGQPVVETIGRQLWDRASLWRFGWRAAYDRSPLPSRNLVQQEWDRFVEEEAIPVFDDHMDEMVTAVQRSLADIASDPVVTRELAGVANSLANDPQTLRLFRIILNESVVENPKLHDVWREIWNSDQARHAVDIAGDRLEPLVRQIGDEIFGTRDGGINPDFARVLRNQILGKDRRWIIAIPRTPGTQESLIDTAGPPVIKASDHPMPFPVIYVADPNDLEAAAL